MLLGQRWRAELRGLSPAINTACLTAAPHICSVYSQVVSLQADVQHLKLPSLPTQRSWKRTHQRAGCPPVTSHDFGWQQQTCHSWLAGLRKGRLHQVGGPVLSKASVLFVVHGDFHNPDHLLLGSRSEAVAPSQNTTASVCRLSTHPRWFMLPDCPWQNKFF